MSVATRAKKKIFDGRYEILGIVGRGSGSVVYHARHLSPQANEVALKVLQPRKGLAPSADRLRKEALAMVSARHEHSIKLDDFQSMEHLCYLSMEYAPCADLRQFLLQSAVSETSLAANSSTGIIHSLDPDSKVALLSAAQGEKFFFQLADALSAMHRAGILHRDIKPDNILVTDPEAVKFGDFGVALLPGEEPGIPELQAGVGTLDYMAPEIFEGSYCGPESDVYLLGVTFYELFTGHHPFKHASLASILSCRMDDVIEPLSSLAPNVPVYLAAVIRRCMRYDKAQRYRDGTALFQDLQRQKALHEAEASDLKRTQQSAVTIAFPLKSPKVEPGSLDIEEVPSAVQEVSATASVPTLPSKSPEQQAAEPEQVVPKEIEQTPSIELATVEDDTSSIEESGMENPASVELNLHTNTSSAESQQAEVQIVPPTEPMVQANTSTTPATFEQPSPIDVAIEKKKKKRRRKRKPAKDKGVSANSEVSEDASSNASITGNTSVTPDQETIIAEDTPQLSKKDGGLYEEASANEDGSGNNVSFEAPALPKEAEDLIASLERIFQQEASVLTSTRDEHTSSNTTSSRPDPVSYQASGSSNRASGKSRTRQQIDPSARIRLNTGTPTPSATLALQKQSAITASKVTDDELAKDIVASLERELDDAMDSSTIDNDSYPNVRDRIRPESRSSRKTRPQTSRSESQKKQGAIETITPEPSQQQAAAPKRLAGRATMPRNAGSSYDYPVDSPPIDSPILGTPLNSGTAGNQSAGRQPSSAALSRFQSRVATDTQAAIEKSASQRLDDALMALLGSQDKVTSDSEYGSTGNQASGLSRNGVKESLESPQPSPESSFLSAYQNGGTSSHRSNTNGRLVNGRHEASTSEQDDATLYQEDTLYPGGSNINGYPSRQMSHGRAQNGAYSKAGTSSGEPSPTATPDDGAYSLTKANGQLSVAGGSLTTQSNGDGAAEVTPLSKRGFTAFSQTQRKKFVTAVVGIVIALFILDVILQATTNSGLASRAAKVVGLGANPMLRRSERDLVSFPSLPMGVYSGSATGVGIGREVPLSVIAVQEENEGSSDQSDNATKLFVLVGIEGWIPAQVNLPAKSPDGTLSFSSNGYRLLLKGELKKTKSGERTIEGSLTNITSRKKGLFSLHPVRDQTKK